MVHNESDTYACFFFNPKYYQNEIELNTSMLYENISNMFKAQCWRLATSSRPVYNFIKMTMSQRF